MLFSLVLHSLNISEHLLLMHMVLFAKRMNFTCLFNKSIGSVPSTLRISFDYLVTNQKNKLLNAFMQIGAFNSNAHVIPITDDEKITYFTALYKYSNSTTRLTDILYDFAFGFYPCRNLYWIKNRLLCINRIHSNKDEFFKIIQKIKSWDPVSFTMERRMQYLNTMGIFLNHQNLLIYKKLIDIDIGLWHQSSVAERIRRETPLEIFNATPAIKRKNRSTHLNHYNNIRIWSEEFINLENNHILIKDASIKSSTGIDFLISNDTLDLLSYSDGSIDLVNNNYTSIDLSLNNLIVSENNVNFNKIDQLRNCYVGFNGSDIDLLVSYNL